MPQIFAKDTKLKLIEYGSNQQGLECIDDLKSKMLGFLQNVIKK